MNHNRLDNMRKGTRVAKEAAAARDAALAPILRELVSLAPQRVAFELERRGFSPISYQTVKRARRRLGLPDWKPAAPEARRRRPAPNEEPAAT